jgi:hypothetical protein
MRRAQLSDCSSLSSVTDDKYMDTDSDSDSYGIEPTVFDSDADSDADYNADSSINCNDACKAPA